MEPPSLCLLWEQWLIELMRLRKQRPSQSMPGHPIHNHRTTNPRTEFSQVPTLFFSVIILKGSWPSIGRKVKSERFMFKVRRFLVSRLAVHKGKDENRPQGRNRLFWFSFFGYGCLDQRVPNRLEWTVAKDPFTQTVCEMRKFSVVGRVWLYRPTHSPLCSSTTRPFGAITRTKETRKERLHKEWSDPWNHRFDEELNRMIERQ